MFDLSHEILIAAARTKWGDRVAISSPYFVDENCVRVGVYLIDSDISFGANFWYREGEFK